MKKKVFKNLYFGGVLASHPQVNPVFISSYRQQDPGNRKSAECGTFNIVKTSKN